MSNVKEKIKVLLDKIPDDITLEDLQYHIFLLQRLEKGEQQIKEGAFYTSDEMKGLLEEWSKEK